MATVDASSLCCSGTGCFSEAHELSGGVMCRRHWMKVPNVLREALQGTKQFSRRWLKLAQAAVDTVREEEQRTAIKAQRAFRGLMRGNQVWAVC